MDTALLKRVEDEIAQAQTCLEECRLAIQDWDRPRLVQMLGVVQRFAAAAQRQLGEGFVEATLLDDD